MSRPPKPGRAKIQLRQETDRLKTALVLLRGELASKEGYAGRLEILLRERLRRVDELTATIDRLRDQNRRLDVENDRLAAMVQQLPSL
jgi:hypothetical protein